MDRDLQDARELVQAAKRVAVLTGSGMSAESGVPTFRGEHSLWEGVDVMEVASVQGFESDPEAVWRFYIERITQYTHVEPNAGHAALAELERQTAERGGSFTLITQNIDGLHQAAGSRNVLELHGNGRRVRCTQCEYERQIDAEPLSNLPTCPDCRAVLRPDVVWFGESLPIDIFLAAEHAARHCDLFISVGTSSVVQPAASLIEIADGAGAKTIEVNPDRTPVSDLADITLRGPAGEVMPELVKLDP
ncbi:MAG: SIR2 family NAD-dependent protein deacylase [Planctomycetota bacterium]|jgi:NAD-dependent deacetylase